MSAFFGRSVLPSPRLEESDWDSEVEQVSRSDCTCSVDWCLRQPKILFSKTLCRDANMNRF